MALLQLGELLERQRVDRTEQAQLAVELARPRLGRHPLGQRRHLGGLGHAGLDVEVVAQHLDGRLQAQPGLGLVDLRPAGPLADLVERPFGCSPCGPQLVEVGRQRADLLALPAALLDELGVVGVDDGAVLVDEAPETIEGHERPLDLDAPLRRLLPGLGVVGQPPLGGIEAVLQELRPLGQPGGAHVEVAAPSGEDGGTGVELGAGLPAGPGGVGLGGLPRLQLRHQQLQLGDPPGVGRPGGW